VLSVAPADVAEEVSPLLVTTEGIVWFGSSEGLVRWDPAEGGADPEPLVHVAAVRTRGRTKVAPGATLDHDDNDVTLEFEGVFLRDPGALRYRMRLVGLEDGWSVPTPVRQARFVNLPPGPYRFQVEAAVGGSWSPPAEVSFTVKPAPWHTRPVQAALAGGALALLAGGYAGTVFALRRRAQVRLRMLEREQQGRIAGLRDLLVSVQRVNSRLDPTPLLEALAEEGARLVEAHPVRVGFSEDGRLLRTRAFQEAEAVWAPEPAVPDTLAGEVAQSGAFRIQERRIAAPIRNRQGRLAAVVEVKRHRDRPAFQDADREILQSFAAQAAVALENAALYGELAEKNEALERAMGELDAHYRQEREASRALGRLNKMKSDFIVLASHELRTPLTVLKGYTDAWMAGLAGEVPRPESIQACNRMVDRMVEAFHNIIETLRLEGNPVLARERIDLAALVREAAADLGAFASARGQTLDLDAAALLPVQGDPGKLRLVLINLLQNASKFTPDGGRIRVAATAGEAEVRVVVEDTGVGIDPAEAQAVFERFYTGRDTSRHSSGTFEFLAMGPGLGLAVAKGYVEAHGGRIWVESEGKGRGSRFIVALPRA
jgi:signal transduction histidine kinase